MIRFFKQLLGKIPNHNTLNLARDLEIRQSVSEVCDLQQKGDIKSLQLALNKISQTQEKYPSSFDVMRYYRGEVANSLLKKLDDNRPRLR